MYISNPFSFLCFSVSIRPFPRRNASLTNPVSMSFPPAGKLWATTMVRDPMLFCDASWFNPNKVRSFPVAGDLDVDGMLPWSLSLNQFLYFEWQHCCTFSLGDPVRVRRRWSRGRWCARSDRTTPKVRPVELAVLKLILLVGPRLLRASFEGDPWQAPDDKDA